MTNVIDVTPIPQGADDAQEVRPTPSTRRYVVQVEYANGEQVRIECNRIRLARSHSGRWVDATFEDQWPITKDTSDAHRSTTASDGRRVMVKIETWDFTGVQAGHRSDMDYAAAWAIQKEVGDSLKHHRRCSSVPGWDPISGPGFLCDCGAVEDEYIRREAEQGGE